MSKTLPLVVPVASVPTVLKFVENVSVKLVVPLVVTMTEAISPAVQFVALSVSACPGVSVNAVPLEKSTVTVEPAVSAAVPMPPFAGGNIPVACVLRFTSVVDASANNDKNSKANTVLCFTHLVPVAEQL